ncbi:hypothetical protein AAVH_13974 [Aphelenchoides avenae]|nr:hypothetical protein AAVH_13974 [Aphelenchus avenae]
MSIVGFICIYASTINRSPAFTMNNEPRERTVDHASEPLHDQDKDAGIKRNQKTSHRGGRDDHYPTQVASHFL